MTIYIVMFIGTEATSHIDGVFQYKITAESAIRQYKESGDTGTYYIREMELNQDED